MLRVFRSVLAMLLLITLLVLTACGPKSKTVQDYAIIEDTSGFELDASQDLVLVNKRRGAPSLAAYNRFIIDAVQVVYTDPNNERVKARRYWTNATVLPGCDGQGAAQGGV